MPNSKEIKLKNYLNVMKNSFKDKRTNIPIIYLLSLTFSVLSIFIALISKNLVDNLLNLNIDGIFNIVIISIGAYLFGSLVGYFSSYFQKYVIDRFKMDLQLSFYDNIQKSHYSFILNISSIADTNNTINIRLTIYGYANVMKTQAKATAVRNR